MKAKQNQLRFETSVENLEKEYKIYQKSSIKLDIKLTEFQKQLKKIKKYLFEIQANIRSNNPTSKEKKDLLKRYQDRFKQLQERLQKFQLEKQKNQKQSLFAGKIDRNQGSVVGNGIVNIGNQHKVNESKQMMNENLDIAGRIRKEAYVFDNTTNQMGEVLLDQRKVMMNATEDVNVINDEVGTINKLMKIIRNKQLLNKIILLSLALFLILADVILLALKFKL